MSRLWNSGLQIELCRSLDVYTKTSEGAAACGRLHYAGGCSGAGRMPFPLPLFPRHKPCLILIVLEKETGVVISHDPREKPINPLLLPPKCAEKLAQYMQLM